MRGVHFGPMEPIMDGPNRGALPEQAKRRGYDGQGTLVAAAP